MAKLKPFDPFVPVRENPLKVTAFEINPAAYRNMGFSNPPVKAFPRELFACRNLESLKLFRAIEYDGDQSIPAEIGTFAQLETLELGGLGFTTLPDTIGRLKKLKTLDLVYCESLTSLPDTIGALTQLKALSLGYTKLKVLPASVGKCRKLEKLSIANVREVPAEIFKLTKLTSLALPDSVERLPPGLGRLTQLTELSISAQALTAAAKELPKLTKLQTLWVSGQARELPETLSALKTLQKLSIGYLGLKKMPNLEGFTVLAELNVSGNQLTELAPLVLSLPKLTELSFSGNPLIAGEKGRVDQLMRLSPAKRKKAPAAKAKKPAVVATPTRVGDVTSVNGSLDMLVADAVIGASFQGIDNATDSDDDEMTGSDWELLTNTLDDDDAGTFSLRGKPALALSLGMGAGSVSVWRIGARLTLVEAFFESDEESLGGEDLELFHAFVAGDAGKRAKKAGTVSITCGQVVIMPSTDACTGVSKLVAKKKDKGTQCGSERSGLLLPLASGTYRVLLEPEVESAWGSGRRCHLVP